MNIENKDFLNVVSDLFSIHEYKEQIDLETFTDGRVNMFISLEKDNSTSYHSQFLKYVDSFDVDGAILTYLQDPTYRNHFSIECSLKDFKGFKQWLQSIAIHLSNPNSTKPSTFKQYFDDDELFILHTCDAHKSHDSMHLIGVVPVENTDLLINKVKELLDNDIIGEEDEEYDLRQELIFKSHPDIPYFHITKIKKNDVITDGGYF